MKRWLICLIALLTISCTLEAKVSVKSSRWFDYRLFFTDMIFAQTRYGETVASMILRTKGIYGVNATYFGRYPTKQAQLFQIGDIYSHLENVSLCPAPKNRGYIWQTDILEIGFHPPKKTIFSAPAGPVLIYKKAMFPAYPEYFAKSFWNQKCLRTIVATKGHRFYFMKIKGNLWEIGKYLKKCGYESAINLDGDSSSVSAAKVTNALVAYSKKREFYQLFAQKHFNETESIYSTITGL